MIPPNCALYSYDHGIVPDKPLQTKGPIIIDAHAWLAFEVIVLSGVRIDKVQ
jgi:acetyltransferase-like isoleucine patch superfamily enzyme